jgi:hypothetical protein
LFNFNGKMFLRLVLCCSFFSQDPFLLFALLVDLRPDFVLLYSCLSLHPNLSFFFPWQVWPWISLPRAVPCRRQTEGLMIFCLATAEASSSLALSPVVEVDGLIFPHRESV